MPGADPCPSLGCDSLKCSLRRDGKLFVTLQAVTCCFAPCPCSSPAADALLKNNELVACRRGLADMSHEGWKIRCEGSIATNRSARCAHHLYKCQLNNKPAFRVRRLMGSNWDLPCRCSLGKDVSAPAELNHVESETQPTGGHPRPSKS